VVKKIILEMVGDLTNHTKEAINFFNHHYSSWGPIEKIFICGGGANIKNIDKTIQEKTGISTFLGNVFVNFNENKKNSLANFKKTFGLNIDFLSEEKIKQLKIKESKTIKVSHDTSLSYATAIGLALRGIFIDE